MMMMVIFFIPFFLWSLRAINIEVVAAVDSPSASPQQRLPWASSGVVDNHDDDDDDGEDRYKKQMILLISKLQKDVECLANAVESMAAENNNNNNNHKQNLKEKSTLGSLFQSFLGRQQHNPPNCVFFLKSHDDGTYLSESPGDSVGMAKKPTANGMWSLETISSSGTNGEVIIIKHLGLGKHLSSKFDFSVPADKTDPRLRVSLVPQRMSWQQWAPQWMSWQQWVPQWMSWEKWEKVDLGHGKVAFRSQHWGKLLSASSGSNGNVGLASSLGTTEQWEMQPTANHPTDDS